MTDTLSQHIAALLRRNDCVIVPGIGAFVATRHEALVSSNVMLPPRREITFNPAMTHDDGLLAGSVSRRLRISFTQARERVAAEVTLLQRRLQAEGAVNLTNIGLLQRRSGGRLDFTAHSPWLIMPQINVVKTAPVVKISPEAQDDKAVAIVRIPLRFRWLRVAAAAIIVGILGFALSTPIDIDTAVNASLAAPSFTPPEQTVIRPLPEPKNMLLNIAMAPASSVVSAIKPVSEAPKPYVMVVASLPTLEKAEMFMAECGDSSLKIFHSGEKFRVYAAEGETPEAARAAAENISGFSSRFPDAWVCRR